MKKWIYLVFLSILMPAAVLCGDTARSWSPETDQARTLGEPARRWSTVYAPGLNDGEGNAVTVAELAALAESGFVTDAEHAADLAAKADATHTHEDIQAELDTKATQSALDTITDALAAKADAADLSGYAPVNSPAFTGTPTVPTAAAGTNTTQAASTALVQKAVAGSVGSSGGVQVVGAGSTLGSAGGPYKSGIVTNIVHTATGRYTVTLSTQIIRTTHLVICQSMASGRTAFVANYGTLTNTIELKSYSGVTSTYDSGDIQFIIVKL